MSEKPEYINIKSLLSSDEYIIPLYQREYAWGEAEITQLLRDIMDHYDKDSGLKYHLGTLTTYKEIPDGSIYETIDGQQRLVTLNLICIALYNEFDKVNIDWYKIPNISFKSREKDTQTIKLLFDGYAIDAIDHNTNIANGYVTIVRALSSMENNELMNMSDFSEYIFENVSILRVQVPRDADLNNYFERMNSRGEQLEMHERVKATLIEKIDSEKHKEIFNLIWEATSNMEKYIQLGFNKKQRDMIFGTDWNKLADEEAVYNIEINKNQNGSKDNNIESRKSLKEILAESKNANQNSENTDEEKSEKFSSVINFPNFLLHILRIQQDTDIPLDDKKIIDTFDEVLKKENNTSSWVKTFGYNLLKGKFLFDKYVIKRENSNVQNEYGLRQMKQNDKSFYYINTFGNMSKSLVMTQMMFNVSSPTQAYKYWLYSSLKYCMATEEVSEDTYLIHLENLAEAYLKDRFIAQETIDYKTIIDDNKSIPQNTKAKSLEIRNLNTGTNVENFVFNYLDYLLWKDYQTDKKYFKTTGNETLSDPKIDNFKFTFRNSVEHFYPQNPKNESDKLIGEDKKWLDNFGNLCLISRSRNSSLSNYMPTAKKEHYDKSTAIDSIKQRIMMDYEYWGIATEGKSNVIEEHGNKMIQLLLSAKNI